MAGRTMARVRKMSSEKPVGFKVGLNTFPMGCLMSSSGDAVQTCLSITASGILVLIVTVMGVLPAAAGNGTLGGQPLQLLKGNSPHSLVPSSIRPLLTAPELETYLRELEGQPPPWDQLASHDMTEQSERLFQFNRHRDAIRENHPALLQQSVAFVWSGELRHFHEEQQGYTIALGPDIIQTDWGLVRFKPRDIPENMMAGIPADGKEEILETLNSRKTREIGILFIGRLTESESIMYAFSHDGDHAGMILPFVNITDLKYFLKE